MNMNLKLIETGEIDPKEIVIDDDIYRHRRLREDRVREYVDDLRKGDVFPPIALQRRNGHDVLVGGRHRLRAREQYAQEKAVYDEQKGKDDGEWPTLNGKIQAEWYDSSVPSWLLQMFLNSKHGLRSTPEEKKDAAREAYQTTGLTQKEIGELVGASRRQIGEYCRDLIALKGEQEQHVIFRLDRLGWTQEEIGKELGMSQQGAREKLQEMAEPPKLVISDLAKGFTPDQVSARTGWPLLCVLALRAEGWDDLRRLREGMDWKPQPYDFWSIQGSDPRFGNPDWPGRIPAQLVAQTLYFFTEPGELVLDPMAGGGTVPDVCLILGRKCYAYDIAVDTEDGKHRRCDVMHHDLATGWPVRVKKADLVFWDPPYFSKKDKDYGEGSISRLARSEYLAFFGERFKELRASVRKGTRLAFLMSDWDPEAEKNRKLKDEEPIFLWHYAKLIEESGWRIARHIQVPLTSQQVHPDVYQRFSAEKRLARLERYLLIAVA